MNSARKKLNHHLLILSPKAHTRALNGQCDTCSPIIATQIEATSNRHLSSRHRFAITGEMIAVPIDNDHVACLSPYENLFSVLNGPAHHLLSAFEAAVPLGELLRQWGGSAELAFRLKQLQRAGLIRALAAHRPRLRESPHKLSAWLHLTDRCNLRCAYCYLPHHGEDMPAGIGRAAIDAVLRSAEKHHYPAVKLKYAGGEPLLRADLIGHLHPYARKRAEEKGIELEGVILSNGTLLSEDKIDLIRSLDLRVMVSLDGLGPAHDRQRQTAGGGGSCQKTIQGIERLQTAGIETDISVTVSGRSAAGLGTLTRWLLARKLPFAINLYRENQRSSGDPVLHLEEKQILAGLRSAFTAIAADPPDRSLLVSLADQTNLAVPHLRPCSVGHSYLVFDPRGRVSKCQMQMGRAITSIAAQDPLGVVRQDSSGICNLSVEEKPACRACEWKYWCAGGCPLANFRATGRYDAKSPHCAVYKAILPEIMRLEALRLLKYHHPAN